MLQQSLKTKSALRSFEETYKPILKQSEGGSCPGNRWEAIISESQGFKKEEKAKHQKKNKRKSYRKLRKGLTKDPYNKVALLPSCP